MCSYEVEVQKSQQRTVNLSCWSYIEG
jgi:hypothetical protein